MGRLNLDLIPGAVSSPIVSSMKDVVTLDMFPTLHLVNNVYIVNIYMYVNYVLELLYMYTDPAMVLNKCLFCS